jgi:hypothetical protein
VLNWCVSGKNLGEGQGVERSIQCISFRSVASVANRSIPQLMTTRDRHVSAEADDVALHALPEEESGRGGGCRLVCLYEVAGRIVSELGLHVKAHDVEVGPHLASTRYVVNYRKDTRFIAHELICQEVRPPYADSPF